MNRKAVILCGEYSGETYALGLLPHLIEAGFAVSGMGSDRLRDAGMQVVQDYRNLSVVGISEVLAHFSELKAAARKLEQHIHAEKPDVLICVDFPEFNTRIARRVKKSVGRLVYMVPPQVWAWRRYRGRGLSRLFDRIFVLFPFETALFDNAEFHGHPMTDMVVPELDADAFRQQYGLEPDRRRVLLLPGSRRREWSGIGPVMIDAATEIRRRWPDVELMLLPSPGMDADSLSGLLARLPDSVVVVEQDHKYAAMDAATVAVGASGTITLECGLSGLPMSVLYQLSPLTYAVGMLVVVSRFISLPNVVLDEAVLDERVNRDCTPDAVLRYVERMLDHPKELERVRRRLGLLRERLHREVPFARITERILEL